jgi:hypothetical protein
MITERFAVNLNLVLGVDEYCMALMLNQQPDLTEVCAMEICEHEIYFQICLCYGTPEVVDRVPLSHQSCLRNNIICLYYYT